MRPTLVICHRVNFIDDDRLDRPQNFAAPRRRQQDVQRLRRRHQNLWWPHQHRSPIFRERVARAHSRSNCRHQQPTLSCELQNLAQRRFQVFLNVVSESLQRRDVHNFNLIL
jgi:hypothetical protein